MHFDTMVPQANVSQHYYNDELNYMNNMNNHNGGYFAPGSDIHEPSAFVTY